MGNFVQNKYDFMVRSKFSHYLGRGGATMLYEQQKFCLGAWLKHIFVDITWFCCSLIQGDLPCKNCSFAKNFHTNQLSEITVFYAVSEIVSVLSCGVLELLVLFELLEKILENFCWKFHFNKVVCQKFY